LLHYSPKQIIDHIPELPEAYRLTNTVARKKFTTYCWNFTLRKRLEQMKKKQIPSSADAKTPTTPFPGVESPSNYHIGGAFRGAPLHSIRERQHHEIQMFVLSNCNKAIHCNEQGFERLIAFSEKAVSCHDKRFESMLMSVKFKTIREEFVEDMSANPVHSAAVPSLKG
jgi:hypothetical protein